MKQESWSVEMLSHSTCDGRESYEESINFNYCERKTISSNGLYFHLERKSVAGAVIMRAKRSTLDERTVTKFESLRIIGTAA